MKQKQRGRKRGEGFSSFASSVCGIINLSAIPGLKEASVREIMYYVWRYQCKKIDKKKWKEKKIDSSF